MADIVYTTVNFPPAVIGVPYEAAVGMTMDGTLASFAKSTGTLPTGISVISGGADPRLHGTPTATGTFTFTLTANDGNGAVVSGSYTITVYGTWGDIPASGIDATPTAVVYQEWPLSA